MMGKWIKIAALAAFTAGAAGCAANTELQAQVDEAMRAAQAAQSAAESAQQTAESAQQTANAAQQSADEAANSVEQAMQEAQACCQANSQRIERMFEEMQRK